MYIVLLYQIFNYYFTLFIFLFFIFLFFYLIFYFFFFFFFQAEDGIRDRDVTGVQTWLFRSRGGRARPRPRPPPCRRHPGPARSRRSSGASPGSCRVTSLSGSTTATFRGCRATS